MPVGFKIKKLREENNLSQSLLADQLGISQSELSKIENGRAKKIDIYLMIEICKYFNKSLDFFTPEKKSEEEEENFSIEISSSIVLDELKKIINEFQKKNKK
ncbi:MULTISPECIES: helix-turn-helix domain-containing protein [Flavobacterium]|uniref:Helix-turn-helix transcriptional regulator n=1 Tax=Flavobacterium endoglycinae TaxID=2816357 RepID=A0ABX7QJ41_9FLAO|nr:MULTISPECIES: helix-turn-helix transcriptional regulator [Flavobacterium]QSW90952.1 helix-turn-helix transcriptional regulator [Flavobacterium endoglycinae]